MKTMKNLALLLLTVVAGNSAQAQTQYVTAGKPYTFTATTAEGTGTISYQWFRNGEPISGATSQSCTLPDNLAYGENVEFKRGAVSSACPYNTSYTNAFTVTFVAPEPSAGGSTLISSSSGGAIRWAATNVDDYQTFATRPDMYTKFYMWNKTTAWAATGTISGWPAGDYSATWTVNPCPAGWRLPTLDEFQALHYSSVPIGGTWADANAKGNAVAGRFYGPNSASCTLPSSMTNCIFLPAAGYRNMSGALDRQGSHGLHWCSTQYSSSSYGQHLYCYKNFSGMNYIDKRQGLTVRCVQ